MKATFNLLVLTMFTLLQARSQEPAANDIIINEILFNPTKDGFDYIEGYNRSEKVIALNRLMIANRNSVGEIANPKLISKDSVKVRPGGFFVITANEKWLQQHYRVPDNAIICQVSQLPTFADDEGSVVLLRKADTIVVDTIIDEVSYSEKWHFKMIGDPEGVALERIHSELPSQDRNNWTSASSASGSGTPGSVNSQSGQSFTGNEEVSVLPKIVTPDNDGIDDFAQVSVHATGEGQIANAIIYNAWGARVRHLVKNEWLGLHNRFTWDGLDDRSQKVATGVYIVCTQVFDTRGNTKKYKHCVVIGNMKR